MSRTGAFRLSHDRCPVHRYEAISLRSPDGTGLRLTSGKCCGGWASLKSWSIDPWDLAVDIVAEANGLTQEQRFDLRDRIEKLMPKRDEKFTRSASGGER